MFTKKRLITKIVLWRIIAFLTTLIIALIETGSFKESGILSIINAVSKLIMMYGYEHIWMKISFGIVEEDGKKKETKCRVFTKTSGWRLIASTTTVILAYAVTKSIEEAFTIGIADFIVKTILLYIYEFIWHRVKWGIINEDEGEKTEMVNV